MQIGGRASAILAQKKVSSVWTIDPNATVIAAIRLMDEKRKVILKERSSQEILVREIMTKQLLTVAPSDSVTECMRIMTEKRVRHLPVLEGTDLVGMLSIR